LEAIAYQVKEVVQAINKDSDAEIKLLKWMAVPVRITFDAVSG